MRNLDCKATLPGILVKNQWDTVSVIDINMLTSDLFVKSLVRMLKQQLWNLPFLKNYYCLDGIFPDVDKEDCMKRKTEFLKWKSNYKEINILKGIL